MLYNLMNGHYLNGLLLTGAIVAFFATVIATKMAFSHLPSDMGREFAVDGAKSKGKPRGAGIVFVLVFIVCTLLFVPFQPELFFYLILIGLAMLTGFLDDASRSPWGEYRKGLLDLLIAVFVAVVYLYYNGNIVNLAIFNASFSLPYGVFGLLVVILVWASINVTNCTDGVDGLSATLVMITLGTIYVLDTLLGTKDEVALSIPLFILVLLAYLWYNATPSLLLMGDAGSRAMGLFISIAILKTGCPVLYLLVALVLIVDGGIGLIKVSLKRFLKISILKNTLTPLHDHVRKNKGWSNTQVVFRFSIIQLLLSFLTIYLVK